MSIATATGPDDSWSSTLEEGHRLRRLEAHAAALDRYAEAAAQAPAEAAPHLHRGHALRLLGRREDAEAAYRLAAMLDPLDPAVPAALAALREEAAVPELPVASVATAPTAATLPHAPPAAAAPATRPRMAMMRAGATAAVRPETRAPASPFPGGPAAPRVATPVGPAISYDVSDLLLHCERARTPTGIQRVQAGVLGAALHRGAEEHRFLAFDRDEAAWREVPAAGLSALLALSAAGGDTGDPDWVEARDGLAARVASARPALFPAGGVLANLGNSWGLPDYFRALRTAQRGGGALYVPFLHDCVPLAMPEHCVRTLVEDYARWFGGMALHAHAVLCNSESTRTEGLHYLAALDSRLDVPVEVVRLDADPRGASPADHAALAAIGGPRAGDNYVLFVATIESRKDHLTVFRAWLTLIRRHGAARIPRLVCAGGLGWHAEAALGLLENSPELAAHVTLLHGVSDPALAALYEGCRFTVYNSHHEGWGLPVTESIAWGKVPVVPRHSGLVESGGEAAVFVSPGSESELAMAVERLALEPGALTAAETRLGAARNLRSWGAVEADIVRRLQDAARRPARPAASRAAVRPGATLRTRRETNLRPALDLAVAESLRDGPGWHAPEGWGCWSSGGRATLRVPVDDALAGSAVRIALELRLPDGIGEVGLRVGADTMVGGRIAAGPTGDVATGLTLNLPATAREISVTIESAPVALKEDPRHVGAGLRGVMLCREDDLEARLRFLEAQRLAAGP